MSKIKGVNKKIKYFGFTLIELLVVIVIIGILSSIGISTFSNYREKARVAKVLAFAKQVDDVMLREIATDQSKDAIGFWTFNPDTLKAVDKFGRYTESSANPDMNFISDTPNGSLSASLALQPTFGGSFVRDITTQINTPAVTASLWIKHSGDFGSAAYETPIAWNGPTDALFLTATGSLFVFSGSTGAYEYINTNDYLKPNRWYHILVVLTSNEDVKIYIDGELTNSNTGSSPNGSDQSIWRIQFGGDNNGALNSDSILMTDPRIYPFTFTNIKQ